MFPARYLFFIFFFSIIFFNLHANNTLPDIGVIATNTLSLEEEARIGKIYAKELKKQLTVIDDPLTNMYIKNIGYTLLSHNQDIKNSFHFFLIQKNDINAFAFFGGHIGIFTGLILACKTEDEFASVLSHEIAHITQRHLARQIAAQTPTMNIASIIASTLLILVSPQAGMASLHTSLALQQQHAINYTRSNEVEADQIGLTVLTKSGYNPYAAYHFFKTLSNQHQFAQMPPALLLTHPLTNERMNFVLNFALQIPEKDYPKHPNFDIIQQRIQVLYTTSKYDQLKNKYQKEKKEYGLALIAYVEKEYTQALSYVNKLLSESPYNIFFSTLKADILVAQKKYQESIDYLYQIKENSFYLPIIHLHLAKAYIEKKEYRQAKTILELYLQKNTEKTVALNMLLTVYSKLSLYVDFFVTQAKIQFATGRYQESIDSLKKALTQQQISHYQKIKIDAEIRAYTLQYQQVKQILK